MAVAAESAAMGYEAAAAEWETPPDDVFDKLGFTPNPGPQARFLGLPDENIDVLFGGAVGGSKSTSLLAYAIRACIRFPGLQAFWFRRTFPELEHSVIRLLARWGYGQVLGCRWNAGKYELRFPGTSTLTFAHAKNVKEATAFLSAEMNLLLIDERTTLPPDVVDMLYTRIRSGVPGVPVLGCRSATNPGDVGHSRVLSDYIEATDHGEREITDGNGRRRIFIQSRIGDTPQLGADYLRNLAGLPEKLRKAYLEGDWTVFAGQVFDEWRHARHVVRPFAIPETWQKYTGTDWGFANPWCTLWLGVDPDGRVYVYRELYATQTGETEQARQILAAEAGDERIAVRFADDAMWSSRGQERSIADAYADEGCHLTQAGKGPGSRLARVQRMHTYLGEAPACPVHRAAGWETCPKIHVFTGCVNLIRTLPTLPHPQSGQVEDVDTNAEDHCFPADTLVDTSQGPRRIADLAGREGWTFGMHGEPVRFGNVRLTRRAAELVTVVLADGRSVTCTPDHLIATPEGWKQASTLDHGSRVMTHSATVGAWTPLSSRPQSSSMRELATTCAGGTFSARTNDFTGASGRTPTALFLRAGTYITTTRTAPTTDSPTLFSKRVASTWPITARDLRTQPEPPVRATLASMLPRAMRGSEPRTGPRPPAMAGATSPWSRSTASPAGTNFSPRFRREPSTAEEPARSVAVAAVLPAGRADVYDLDVDHPDHAFSVNGGIVVHNCYDALTYVLANLGTGPAFILPDAPPAAADDWGVTLLEPYGAFARSRDGREPAAGSGGDAGGEDDPARGTVQRAPWT